MFEHNKRLLNNSNSTFKGNKLYEILKEIEIGEEHYDQKETRELEFGPEKSIFLVLSGWLIGIRSNLDGDMKGTGLNGPGDLLGLVGLSGVTKNVPFYAVSDVTLARFSTKQFLHLLKINVDLNTYMIGYLSERYSKLLDELECSTLLPLSERIEIFINQTEALHQRNLTVPQTVIAFAVGAHPVSVNRLLHNKHIDNEH